LLRFQYLLYLAGFPKLLSLGSLDSIADTELVMPAWSVLMLTMIGIAGFLVAYLLHIYPNSPVTRKYSLILLSIMCFWLASRLRKFLGDSNYLQGQIDAVDSRMAAGPLPDPSVVFDGFSGEYMLGLAIFATMAVLGQICFGSNLLSSSARMRVSCIVSQVLSFLIWPSTIYLASSAYGMFFGYVGSGLYREPLFPYYLHILYFSVLALFLVRAQQNRGAILFLRSFSYSKASIAFGNIVAPVASPFCTIIGAAHKMQSASNVHRKTAIINYATLSAVADEQWKDWFVQQLTRSLAVIIDRSTETGSLLEEIELVQRSIPTAKVVVLQHVDNSAPDIPGVLTIRYRLGYSGEAEARELLYDWLRRLLLTTRDTRAELSHT
jgi:hypothetical protein